MRTRVLIVASALAAVIVPGWFMARSLTLPHTFQNGDVADANQVNENFAAVQGAFDAVGTQSKALKPRFAGGGDTNGYGEGGCGGECRFGCGPGLKCGADGVTCVVPCTSDADCGLPGLCSMQYSECTCIAQLVDYSGSGYLLAVHADADCRSDADVPPVTIAIDDDTPQEVNMSLFVRSWSDASASGNSFGRCKSWDMPLGGGLRFTNRLRVFARSSGRQRRPAPAIVYAIE